MPKSGITYLTIQELLEVSGLSKKEFSEGICWALKKGWIEKERNVVVLTSVGQLALGIKIEVNFEEKN